MKQKFVWKTRASEVFVELRSKTTDKSMFCEAMRRIEKSLVFNVHQPMCCLEVLNLNCVTANDEVVEAIKNEIRQTENCQCNEH